MPDLFVVLGVAHAPWRVYKVWEEGDRVPDSVDGTQRIACAGTPRRCSVGCGLTASRNRAPRSQ